tara:strand:+ start:884 stop:1714 length:831 start_codon:yes stop_codon:yes gene_type:complete
MNDAFISQLEARAERLAAEHRQTVRLLNMVMRRGKPTYRSSVVKAISGAGAGQNLVSAGADSKPKNLMELAMREMKANRDVAEFTQTASAEGVNVAKATQNAAEVAQAAAADAQRAADQSAAAAQAAATEAKQAAEQSAAAERSAAAAQAAATEAKQATEQANDKLERQRQELQKYVADHSAAAAQAMATGAKQAAEQSAEATQRHQQLLRRLVEHSSGHEKEAFKKLQDASKSPMYAPQMIDAELTAICEAIEGEDDCKNRGICTWTEEMGCKPE